MKKGLFLLPLVGGLLLSGCSFTLFGKEINIKLPWEKDEQSGGEDGEKGGEGGGSDANKVVLDFTDPSWKNDEITPYISENDMGVMKTFTYEGIDYNDVGCFASNGYNGAPNYLMMKNTKYGSSKDQYATVPAFFGNKTAFSKPIKKVEVKVEGSSSSANCIYRVTIGSAAYEAAPTEGGATGSKGATFSTTSSSNDAYYFAVSTNKTSDGKIYNGQIFSVTVSF